MTANPYSKGDRVRYTTARVNGIAPLATVLRTGPEYDPNEVVILVDGASVHINTRVCYVEPA